MSVRWWEIALLLSMAVPRPGISPLYAQRPLASSSALPALAALDMWLVSHYRGAQLFPDSGKTVRATGAMTALPYVESVSAAQITDTLFAVEFSPNLRAPTLAVGTRVRLTSPSGVVSSSVAEIVTRRAFRAPRVPNARLTEPDDYRYGWSYLLMVRQSATTPSAAYRGWLLTDVPVTPLTVRPK